jgi:UPF0755 protein
MIYKLASVLILLGIFGLGILLYSRLNQPLAFKTSGSDQYLLINIPSKSNLTQICSNLKDAGVLQQPRLFIYYLRFTRQDRKVKSGYYHISADWTLRELAHHLTNGNTAVNKVTIPEGLASWEIFSILKRHFILDSTILDSLTHDRDFVAACSITALSLEGYLYPDTYFFPYSLSEQAVLKIMTRQFWNVFRKLNYPQSQVFVKYGIHGLITLASIVEEEAAVNDEKPLIAGVFANRLKKGWPLGADPTIRFILKKLTGPLYRSELNQRNPYNTRIFSGLPPGPVSNPGLRSISAALYPATTDFLFFVAKDNGSKEHFFSKTNRQHNVYKRERQLNQKSL